MTDLEVKVLIANIEPSRLEQAKRLFQIGYRPWAMIFTVHISHREAIAVCELCGRQE